MLRQEKSIPTQRIFSSICKVLCKSLHIDFKLFKIDEYSTWNISAH